MAIEFQIPGFLDELEKLSISPAATGALVGAGLSGASALRHELRIRAEESHAQPEDVERARKNRLLWHAGGVALGTGMGAAAGHYAKPVYEKLRSKVRDLSRESGKHIGESAAASLKDAVTPRWKSHLSKAKAWAHENFKKNLRNAESNKFASTQE